MTALVAPDAARRREALRRANDIKRERHRLRKEVRSLPKTEGVALLADLIVECPGCVGGMRVEELLLWPQQFGPQIASRVAGLLAVRAGASECRRLRDLTPRQCEVMAMTLRRYYGR